MSETDPMAGTTIGPDGKRVPVEDAQHAAAEPHPVTASEPELESVTGLDETVVAGDGEVRNPDPEPVTEPTQETAESVGHATVADATVTGDLPGAAGSTGDAGDAQGHDAQSQVGDNATAAAASEADRQAGASEEETSHDTGGGSSEAGGGPS